MWGGARRPGEPPLGPAGGSALSFLPARYQRSCSQASPGKHPLQLAILFYWLMWASSQEELGLNQYSFYYVIVGK